MKNAGRAILACAALLAPACDSRAQPSAPRRGVDEAEILNPRLAQTGQVRILTRDGRQISVAVEIASNDRDRVRGLMFRRSMPASAGMIFVFPDEAPRSFWMENTYVPLDMIFARADGIIAGIVENAEPMTRTSRAVEGASKFVLEVNGGFCARHGIAPGDRIELVGFYRLE